jgi:hypothetical protein
VDLKLSNLIYFRVEIGGWNERGQGTMTLREIKRLDTRIHAIKKAAQELKKFSGRIPAVDRNAVRILASVKMLEINISDVKDLLSR